MKNDLKLKLVLLLKREMMIDTKTTIQQSRIYIYELCNHAKEFGLSNDEDWKLNVISDTEKVAIEKQHHPVVSIKALPELLSELFRLVKDTLSQIKSNFVANPENLSVQGFAIPGCL